MNNQTSIEVKKLSKQFSGKKVLTDISFTIKKGSFTAIIGENGSGKSILLNCMSDLMVFDKGEVTIRLNGNGKEDFTIYPNAKIEHQNKKKGHFNREKIGIVMQELSLMPYWTILENVWRPISDTQNYHIANAQVKARELLKNDLNLQDTDMNKYPHEVSGGIQRRVQIARTLIFEPDILFLDEIEAHLDPDSRETIVRLLQTKYLDQADKTLVMVTHQIDILDIYATDIIVLNQGKLIGNGTRKEILGDQKEIGDFLKKCLDPSRVKWVFLENSRQAISNILSNLVNFSHGEKSLYSSIAKELLNLAENAEKDVPRLVMIVLKDDADKLKIFGISKTEQFELNGDNINSLEELIAKDDRGKRIFKTNKDAIIQKNDGVLFKGSNPNQAIRSLIHQMVFPNEKQNDKSYQYSKNHEPISGPYHVSIDPDTKEQYYEFSKGVKSMYMIPIKQGDNILGVISIDTYNDKKWLPFIVSELMEVAKITANIITLARANSSKDSPTPKKSEPNGTTSKPLLSKEVKEELIKLFIKNKLDEVLERLKKLTHSTDHYKRAILFMAEYDANKKSDMVGDKSEETKKLNEKQLRKNIIDFLYSLNDDNQ